LFLEISNSRWAANAAPDSAISDLTPIHRLGSLSSEQCPSRLVDVLNSFGDADLERIAWIVRGANGAMDGAYTWREIRQRCASAAAFLVSHGVQSQDRVANLCSNQLDWAILDLACSALNAIHAPLDRRLRSHQYRACIEQTQPKVVFCERGDELLDDRWLPIDRLVQSVTAFELSEWTREFRPTDVANILFTSGTSSAPRGVMLTHRNLVSNAMAKLDAMPQNPDDHRLNLLPFAHAYARTCELSTWILSRSSMEVADSMKGLIAIASAASPSLINGVPWLFETIRAHCESTVVGDCTDRELVRRALQAALGKRIRRLACGGAGIRDSTRHWFANLGYPIYQGYGLTEASPVICSNRDETAHHPSILEHVGPPVQGVEIRIDTESRLWVKGDGVMAGYWNDRKATEQRVRDGWLDTGDIVERVSQDQSNIAIVGDCIRILGRADDAIVLTSGYKVHPLPIELHLRSLPEFPVCLLIGNQRPYPILLISIPGELAKLESPEWKAEMMSKVRQVLSGYPAFAVPRAILGVNDRWEFEADLSNFKGALLRSRIEQRYQVAIDLLYKKNHPSS
jgi:long-chain acyl-CoA synthetase